MSASAIEHLLKRAVHEESLASIRVSMVEAELAHHRAMSQAQLDSVITFLEHSEKIVEKFKSDNNGEQHSARRGEGAATQGERRFPPPFSFCLSRLSFLHLLCLVMCVPVSSVRRCWP